LGGSNSFPLFTTPNQTYQYVDDASFLLGKHTLRFGGDFRTGSTDNTRNTFGKGEVRFNSHGGLSPLENFVQGNVQRETVFVGDSHRFVSQKSLGLFVQDDWRASQRLTVTAGLRYDVSFPIKERNNLLANFDPAAGLLQVGKQISQPYNTDYNNFSPRLGVAFDPYGRGKTVIRAGAGIVYEIPHISVFIGQNGANALGLAEIPTGVPGVTPGGGTIVTTTKVLGRSSSTGLYGSGGPIFGDLSAASVTCDPNNLCPILGTVKNLLTPYVINFNVNVEQVLWSKAALTIAYVGNKGNKLYSLRDINQNIVANDVNADEQSGRPFNTQFPYLSFIDQLGNGDSSIYHGLQVTLKQRSSHGLYFVAGYTWARAIDDSSGNRTFDIQNSYDPKAERGNSASDIRNRFTLAMTYDVPSHDGFFQLRKGWALNSIVSAQTGTPLFVFDSTNDISGTGEFNDHWNFFGDFNAVHIDGKHAIPFFADGTTSPACVGTTGGDPILLGQLSAFGCYAGPGFVIAPPAPGTFGNMGRNKIYGPSYVNADLSAIKRFTFGERVTMEFRGEIFNVFNHPNLAGIDHDLSDGSTVGLAFFTPDVEASNPVVGSGGSRHIQLGAKVIF
ncbi:MAG: TonB-dependent receptor, partial [Acidobacteriota bacterium]|nr:TonB-dependent receptor [Acidobacteriota bacterium]